MLRLALAGLLTLALAVPASAADPQGEPLPPPRSLPLPVPPPQFVPVPIGPMGPVLPGFYRPDPYAHWEMLSLNRQNQLRPRVVLAPQPYFLFSGMPYNQLPVRPTFLMPSWVSNPASFR